MAIRVKLLKKIPTSFFRNYFLLNPMLLSFWLNLRYFTRLSRDKYRRFYIAQLDKSETNFSKALVNPHKSSYI
jgi:hypothetical protein